MTPKRVFKWVLYFPVFVFTHAVFWVILTAIDGYKHLKYLNLRRRGKL